MGEREEEYQSIFAKHCAFRRYQTKLGWGEAALTHLRFHFGFDMLILQSLQSTSHLRLITLLIYIHTCDLSRPGATLAVLTADFQGKGA